MPIVIANKGLGGRAAFTSTGGGGMFRMKYSVLPLLLDTYSGAAAAYSLRKLRTAYSGAAIRVRRSSDSTTTDIGFTASGALDEAALTAFVGAGSGFVSIWYDQSGNSRNATQGTAANQPRIVNTGTVDRVNNNTVAIVFDGINDYLSNITAIFLGAQSRTLLAIYKPNNAIGSFVYSIFGQAFGNTAGYWSMIQDRTQSVVGDPYFAGFAADIGNGLTTPNTSQKLAQFYYNGTTGSLYKNNGLLANANITLNAQSSGRIGIGAIPFTSPQEFANASIQECIAYGTTQITNRTPIEQNINNYYAIY